MPFIGKDGKKDPSRLAGDFFISGWQGPETINYAYSEPTHPPDGKGIILVNMKNDPIGIYWSGGRERGRNSQQYGFVNKSSSGWPLKPSREQHLLGLYFIRMSLTRSGQQRGRPVDGEVHTFPSHGHTVMVHLPQTSARNVATRNL